MKKRTIVIVELGIVAGIVLALYTVPNDKRLSTFLIGSGLCFLAGNLLLFARARKTKIGTGAAKSKVWPHLLRVFAILAAVWILVWLSGRV